MEYGATTYELPAEDLGRENIGLYTLTAVGNGPEYGRFSLLNCRTGAITRAEQTDGPNDLRPRIDAIRQKGGLASPADLAREAGRSGLHVIQGQVERTETSRAGCACALLYSKAWYSGFPKGYLPPGPTEIMLID
ncbi:hypothetical protein [Paracoccus sp. M683]|uniref:hypothetical protein n=1 Tax=Paracoccus sp. M683 TaxID=2594268 RepID=UPI00117E5A58|nr:hypothetical protein [Paracoccus sp. M683]